MPIFEYHCQTCRNTFEKLLKTPVVVFPCPTCGQQAGRAVSVPSPTSESSCASPSGSGFR